MGSIYWSLKDIRNYAITRQNNKFDAIMFWSGPRGNGKSTGSFKFCNPFECFKPKHHIVYNRDEVMHFLEENKRGVIMDDEAIRSGYKRNFFDKDQKQLITMLNMYRSNYNIYSGCIPNFFSLDTDLRKLCTIHIHVIKRGLGVVHIPRTERLYGNDPWDAGYNSKVEDSFGHKIRQDPNYKPPFHKLSTFAGYLSYGPMSELQEKLYEDIRQTKRKMVYDEEMGATKDKTPSLIKNIIDMLKQGTIKDNDQLRVIAESNGLKLSNLRTRLNVFLGDSHDDKTVREYLSQCSEISHQTVSNKLQSSKSPFNIES